jgi:hypothetical protein
MTVLNSHIKQLLLLCLQVFLLTIPLYADNGEKKVLLVDSAAMELRQPDASAQEDISNEEDWRYDRDSVLQKQERNVFDRIWDAFTDKISEAFRSDNSGSGSKFWPIFWKILVVLVFLGLVVLVILKATKTGTSRIFKGKSKDAEHTDASIEDVDIHTINYEQMIGEAESRRDYRLAVRLLFLRSLKQLSDKELISWKADKTNGDYYYDLSDSSLQEGFGQVSFVYDYIWYGEFPVNQNVYESTVEKFSQFRSKIDNAQSS